MSGSPRQRRSSHWTLIALLVVLFGLAGFVTVTAATTSTQHTIGEVMLTVALVAGPFLWAEALLSQQGRARRSGPELGDASLAGRDLTGLDLTGRYLRRRQMAAVRLSDADLRGADLTESSLDDARLTNSNLAEAHLHRSSLKSAACFRADLRDADLTEADLRWANLKQADLRGACLVDADLRNADLRGSDLRDTDLRGAALTGARYSRSTRFDASLAPADELARLGLMRHTDEPPGPTPSGATSTRGGVRPTVRIAALAAVVAVVTLGIPAVVPDDPDHDAEVGGVSQERTYYRVTGASQQARVTYVAADGTEVVLVTGLPVSLPTDADLANLSVRAESLDRGGIRCQIHRDGTIVSDAESTGPAALAVCAIGQ